MLDGKIIGTCMPRHRHGEFRCFLKLIDHQTPSGVDLHLVVDNYASHKTLKRDGVRLNRFWIPKSVCF